MVRMAAPVILVARVSLVEAAKAKKQLQEYIFSLRVDEDGTLFCQRFQGKVGGSECVTVNSE